MNRNIIKLLVRITSLSILIVVLFNSASYLLNTINWLANSENVYNFKNNEIELLSKVWVAITTNIWTKFIQKQSNSYVESISLEEIMSDPKDAKKDIIARNMTIIKEYLNILKTDIPKLLNSSNDRRQNLKLFASELNSKYKMASASVINLTNQRNILATSIENSSKKIDEIKSKITTDFSAFNSIKTWENIDEYLTSRKDYYYAKIYIIFIDKFLAQYDFLNNYNKKVLTLLVNNQEALVKDVYVVLPTDWDEWLRKLNLIYDESEYKAILGKEMSVEK